MIGRPLSRESVFMQKYLKVEIDMEITKILQLLMIHNIYQRKLQVSQQMSIFDYQFSSFSTIKTKKTSKKEESSTERKKKGSLQVQKAHNTKTKANNKAYKQMNISQQNHSLKYKQMQSEQSDDKQHSIQLNFLPESDNQQFFQQECLKLLSANKFLTQLVTEAALQKYKIQENIKIIQTKQRRRQLQHQKKQQNNDHKDK